MIPSSYYPSFVPRAYRNPVVGILLLVLGALLIYQIGAKLGWWKGFLSKKGGDPAPVNEAALPAGFNARNEAVGLHQLLSSWDWNPMQDENEEAFDKILAYNDDQLKAVHNAWLTEYRGATYSTLRAQVVGETLFSQTEINKRARILDRMSALGI